MTVTCDLSVNNVTHRVAVDLADTVLSVLRERLGLTGAKRGCNQGVCGACTVLVDERPMRSCLLLAANCEGQSVTTVEGLAGDAIGRALQKAFVEAGAIQCGFCIPGALVSASAVLKRNPRAGVDEIRALMSGNICRCSGYRKIVHAIAKAGAELAT
jgi:carbon-monoxide dehydrogenase small subunit